MFGPLDAFKHGPLVNPSRLMNICCRLNNGWVDDMTIVIVAGIQDPLELWSVETVPVIMAIELSVVGCPLGCPDGWPVGCPLGFHVCTAAVR